MKLTDQDTEYLKKCGYLEKDLKQIEEATKKTVYKINHKGRFPHRKPVIFWGEKHI